MRKHDCGAPRASLGLDVRGLDDGPPFLDFGFVIGGKRLRRLLLGRRDNGSSGEVA
jgi:hypothetical protein